VIEYSIIDNDYKKSGSKYNAYAYAYTYTYTYAYAYAYAGGRA